MKLVCCISYCLAGIISLGLSVPARAADCKLPLFDGHVHYNQDVWQAISPKDAIKRLQKQGIQRAIVSNTPAPGAIKLFNLDKKMVIPFLRPYRSPKDRANWYKNPEILQYVRTQLQRHQYRGLGEFHLFGSQVDTPTMKGLLKLAKQHDLILLSHSDPKTIDALLAAAPGRTIIWAHGGFDVDAKVIRKKLKRNKNLYIELSFRDGIMENGKLTKTWRKIFTKYQKRFLIGTDTYIGERWLELPELVGNYKTWLRQLPCPIAENIAWKNGERIIRQ